MLSNTQIQGGINSNIASLVSFALLLLIITNYSYHWSGQWTHFLTIIGIPLTSILAISGLVKSQSDVAWVWGILLLVLVYVFVPIQKNGDPESNFNRLLNDEVKEEVRPAKQYNTPRIMAEKPISRLATVKKGCDGLYAHATNCETVFFKKGETYSRSAKSGMCVMNTGKKVIERTHLGGNDWVYRSNYDGLITIYFHDIPAGTSFDDTKCG
jgi:hypothetical protein